MTGHEQNVAKQMLAAVQVDKAMKLRVRGANWREVADACGYASAGAALKAVGEAMAAASMRAEQTADSMLDEANLQLEALLSSAVEMIERETFYGQKGEELDDRPSRLKAVDTARRILADKIKLNGLDRVEEKNDEIPTIRVVGISPEEII